MKLVKDLSEENTRLLRDNKRANESLDGMLKDNADLNNRLVNIAFQSPEDGGDIFDDAFADPAELAERAEKRKKAALERQGSAGGADRVATGMDSAMKQRQEATAAEVRSCCCTCSRSSLFCSNSLSEPLVGYPLLYLVEYPLGSASMLESGVPIRKLRMSWLSRKSTCSSS